MTHSSKTLLAKMRTSVDGIENLLRDNKLTAEQQIADVRTFCWGIIQLTFELQRSVGNELHGVEGDTE
jgi:hypothetical protein